MVVEQVMQRFTEPSTWAGLGLIAQGVAQLLASKGADPAGWASLSAGVLAVLKREGGGGVPPRSA